LEPSSIAEVPPNIFLKPTCSGQDLAKQEDSMLSAVELSYLRFAAMFGTESRYCKMPVDSLAAAQGLSYASARGGDGFALEPPPGLGQPVLPATLV